MVALLPNSGGLLKGTVNDRAWGFGGGAEKWVTNLLAVRVDIDALHTTFFNSSAKVHGEYDLRATWGVIYYFGFLAPRSIRPASCPRICATGARC